MNVILALTLSSPMHPQARAAEAINPPVHADEAKILKQILQVEEHSVKVAEMPGWARGDVVDRLKELGVDTNGLKSWAVRGIKDPGLFFGCVHKTDGRALALSGNGPWLRNDSLRALKGMPELRFISIDHNGFLRNHPKSPLYSGTGFEALAASKLVHVKLTLGINDEGLRAIAGIAGLRSLTVAHSQVTDDGLKHLEGHPSLESLTVAEMGKVSQKALASIAKMPRVARIGFQEAFVTYDDGFKHLASRKGRLKELDLSMSVVNDDDLKRARADHPETKITTIPAEEIVKRHSGVANTLARISTGAAAEKLKKAIAEYQPKKK